MYSQPFRLIYMEGFILFGFLFQVLAFSHAVGAPTGPGLMSKAACMLQE